MKIYSKKIIAFVLVLLLTFGSNIHTMVTSAAIDTDINMHLLGKSKEPGQLGLSLGESGETIDVSPPIPLGMSSPMTFAVLDSIGGIIQVQHAANVAIVPGTDGSMYQTFPGTYAGLLEAVFELYNNGGGADYVIYMGSNIIVPVNGVLGNEVAPIVPTATNVSFTSLVGKVGTLVLTTSISDPTTLATTSPSDAKLLTFNTDMNMGTDVVFRNIRYYVGGRAIFGQGHKIKLDRGSFFEGGANFYGGMNWWDIHSDTSIEINSTGSGAQNFYGGNRMGNTIHGNTSIVVNNTSNYVINSIVGGSSVGDIAGNTSITINGTSNAITNIYGGGHGTSTTNIANVAGDVSTNIYSVGGNIGTVYGGMLNGVVTRSVSTNISNVSGNIGNVYGGVYTGDVNGNVSTNISNVSGNISTYYGGAYNGNIAGSITNSLSGIGGFAGAISYFGGSNIGDIGFGLAAGSDAINTVFDSSFSTAGTCNFYGANSISGTITGNINNKVTAKETTGAGNVNMVNGGGALGTVTSGISTTAFVGKTPEEARAMAEAAAKFKVYGNIYTEITKGRVSNSSGNNGYSRGGGFGGYIQGNTTIEVGTEGLVTSANQINNPDVAQHTGKNTRGNATAFDIVGGGGNPDSGNIFFLYGDSKVIMHNVLARWTYGANFSGSTYGNTRIELYGGVVDTCEGAGFSGQQTWGNSSAYVYDGQVDWFLSGGGWNDKDIYGDVSVVVEGGTINASLGGTYGQAAQTIYGNSTILVTGGNFSGRVRSGLNGFSGGATNGGTIKGNSKVTIDLRNSADDMKLADGTSISGGKPFNAPAASKMGTDENNTIELNIFTNERSDVLNSASIYGDGGTAPANTLSGHITVNVDAPGSNVGNFYATQYSNIAASKILRNVVFNIHSMATVKGISGGSELDDFRNGYVASTTNMATINFNPAATALSDHETTAIGAYGLNNFTSLNINNATISIDGAGGIRNGKSASLALHGTYYHQFGDIKMENNAQIHLGEVGAGLISARTLLINDKSTIKSPAVTGKVIVTDTDLSLGGSLYWIKNGGVALASEKGTWFGTNMASKVITFNPDPSKALALTPFNFSGEDGFKPLLGDNETVASTRDGHGIALPGTRINYIIVGGSGTVKHNVNNVLEGSSKPLNGISSVDKDVLVSDEGWLSVIDSFANPKLTITPDSASESWIKEINIIRNDGQVITIPEAANSDAFEWPVPERGFVYDIEITFTDLSELSGKSVILSQTEAAAIATAQDITTYQNISGRPFLKDDINAAFITAINQPLNVDQKIRSHKVTYTAGAGAKLITREYWIGVVPDSAIINLPGREAALIAQDSAMMLAIAQNITATVLDTDYSKAAVLFPDGTTATPHYAGDPIATLNGLTVPTVVPVRYAYNSSDQTIQLGKTVNVNVLPDGVLQLNTVPDILFGSRTIPAINTSFWTQLASDVIVEDSRVNPFGSAWEVTVGVSDLKEPGGKKILAKDIYYTNDNPLIGPVGKEPLNTAKPIWQSSTNAADFQTLSLPANVEYGFSVVINASTIQVGAYTGTATWSLSSTP